MKERIVNYLKLKEVPNTVMEAASAWYKTKEFDQIYKTLPSNVGALSDKVNVRDMREKPLSYLVDGCVDAPIEEELIYRAIPTILPLNPKVNFGVKTISSVVFGYDHNLTSKNKRDYSKLPLSQIYAGLHFYDIAKKRNILHSMIAHSTWNLLCLGLVRYRDVKERMDKKFNAGEIKKLIRG